MDRPGDIGWRQFSIGLIEALRWPIAFVIVAYVLRGPLERLIDALAGAIGS